MKIVIGRKRERERERGEREIHREEYFKEELT